jgi:mono/diheme cytochrome c family protein
LSTLLHNPDRKHDDEKEEGDMRSLIFLLTFTSILAAQTPAPSTGAGAAQAAPAGDAQNGKKLYMERGCFQCHNTLGQGGEGPRLAPRPISFAAFTKELRQPRDQMPPYTAKVMTDKEVADIYAFLLTVPQPPAVSSIPILNR